MDKTAILAKLEKIDVEGKSVKQLYNEISTAIMEEIKPEMPSDGKVAYYLSIEFLMGRMFFNNLMELGISDEVREIFTKKGFDINDMEEIEDMALGNGGLGRLAACYLDSAAAAGYPLVGYGIRYSYGLFRQRFKDGCQIEEADDWLRFGDPWSIRRESEARRVEFADMTATAVPYDMPIIGKTINTLRLFRAEGSPEAEKISELLYPDDSTEEGKLLRIRQEYFLSAAAMGELVDGYVAANGADFSRFPALHSVQLNDTHAVFSVAELIRLLVNCHGLTFDEAVGIAKKTFNYTNHTILPEALERWRADLVEKILPDVAEILKRLQAYAEREWKKLGCTEEECKKMAIYSDGVFSMADTAVFVSEKVNGVAEIHSEIIKEKLFAPAYKHYPDKFMNVTNGVTHRRWLMLCNDGLSSLLDAFVGRGWRDNLEEIERLDTKDKCLISHFIEVKNQKKRELAEYIKKRENVTLLEDAIYVAQVKRLHEYKRQLMTAFALMRLYYDLKEGKLKDFYPTVFIFGAKAASGYRRAKAIIKYINDIAALVNGDPDVNKLLQVVFVQNYDVSYAEKIMAGTDVSLQVSAAGFEASGTGNMKMMMNGAVTVGTMDGANIEIVERAGLENNYIFGATVEDLASLKDYDPKRVADENPPLKRAADTLVDGTFDDMREDFAELYNSIFEGASWHKPDHYFVMLDSESYYNTLLRVNRDYKNRDEFATKQLENVRHSSFFTSDRAIKTYADSIWHISARKD